MIIYLEIEVKLSLSLIYFFLLTKEMFMGFGKALSLVFVWKFKNISEMFVYSKANNTGAYITQNRK